MERDAPDERVRAIERATELADLVPVFGSDSVHEAYFRAKDHWRRAVRRRQQRRPDPEGLAGTAVDIDGQTFHVHGITHADTEAEGRFLRAHVGEFLDRGAGVYCEQGIRSMYFDGLDAVCEMDDYRWAMERCEQLDEVDSLEGIGESERVLEDVAGIASAFRERAFSLIDAGSSMYGERFERALGDVAAEFLTDHADLGMGSSYEAFVIRRNVCEEPQRLHELQRYYERTFLPQPLEREWLRGHDPELEIVSHARNERMTDYAVYHNESTEEVHLVVGAAHQPGVVHYLEQYSDGEPRPQTLELY
jgi:hypothetical protein